MRGAGGAGGTRDHRGEGDARDAGEAGGKGDEGAAVKTAMLKISTMEGEADIRRGEGGAVVVGGEECALGAQGAGGLMRVQEVTLANKSLASFI